MGWTFTHRPKEQTKQDFLKQLLESPNEELLAISVKGSVVYLAVNDKIKNNIFGLVILLKTDSTELYNQGYKFLYEEVGPYYTDCPKYILNLLSPTENKYALAWRKACYNHTNPDYTNIGIVE